MVCVKRIWDPDDSPNKKKHNVKQINEEKYQEEVSWLPAFTRDLHQSALLDKNLKHTQMPEASWVMGEGVSHLTL